jgi:hypothetical protein
LEASAVFFASVPSHSLSALCERGKTDKSNCADDDSLFHGRVPFFFT